MRTTYYHFIDSTIGIGVTYHTLANGTVNEFGIGISSHIGIGTVNNKFAQFAIHHDGPASESKRTGGFEINANSNASGDKHGARILAYNRVFSDKGFRRLRFSASEFQFETPTGGTSTNNADPTFNITGFGSVGIGSTDPLAKLDVRGDVRFNNKLYDKDGDSGTSGQVLSSTGTQIDWINVGELSAGTASQVAITASNSNQNFNVTFVDSSSGNQSIKADTNTNFIYNPSINRLELNTFNGTGLMLSGSGSEYVGMQLKTSDSSASQTRNIFIDAVNETGAAVANMVGAVQADGGSHWRWETQPPGNRNDRRVERLRITANGDVGIGTTNPSTNLHIVSDKNALIKLVSTDANSGIQFIDPDTGAKPPVIYGVGDNFTVWTDFLERFRITQLGNVGIGTTNTIDTFDGGFDRRLVVYGGGAQVGSAYTWTGGDFYHAEDIITAVTKTKSGGFAINCREQEVSATDPSRPIWTLRSYTNEPIAFGQGLTEIARFDENGNLGIGTTSPSVKLDVIGSATVEGDLFLREVPSDGICKINANGNLNLFADGQVKLYESDNNKLMITFDINTVHNDSRIFMEDDNDTYLNHPAENQLGFTVGGTDTIRIKTGQVGIGTDDPSYVLHTFNGGVVGSTENDRKYNGRFTTYTPNRLNLDIYDRRWQNLETHGWHGTEKRIEYNIDDNANKRMWMSFFNPSSTTGDNVIRFGEQEDTEWMRIADGNVGIGTDNPTAGLDVNISGTTQNDYIFLATAGGSDKFRIMGSGLVASYSDFVIGDKGGNSLTSTGANIFISDTDPLIKIARYNTGTSSFESVSEITGSSSGNLLFTSKGPNNTLGGYYFYGKTTGVQPTYLKINSDGAVISGITTHSGQVVYTPMTTTQRDALTAQTGGVIFNSSTSKLQVYNGSAWVDLH